MRRLAALSLFALSGCPTPYDLAAAGVTDADGGVILPIGDGGTFFPTAAAGSNSFRPLRDMPSQETLCMLFIGDFANKSDYPKAIGTWIDDVTAPWFLGTPSRTADFQGPNDVQISYTFRAPGSKDPTGMDTVSLLLGFEYADVVDSQTVVDQDGHWKGQRWYHPYFLSQVQAQGFQFLPCWDWRVRNNEGTHWTPCPDCVNGNQVSTCESLEKYDHVDQCYR